ncbi:PREDICTED: avidin-like, partial [Apaloderma vittatum]|uniref:avidin-like n=1 Tax=Apaloderma vittatum TaxID=57397 RepID=UPI0005217009
MVRATPVLLVLSLLALVAHGLPEKKCVLTGNWTNDLGSNMTIGKVHKEGVFNGTYFTKVANTSTPIKPSPLLGYQNLKIRSDQPTFGFTVNWNFT